MDTDLKWVITEEERTRHDALFYSQNPKKGYLSGKESRDFPNREWKLFILYKPQNTFILTLTLSEYYVVLMLQENKQGLYSYVLGYLSLSSAKYGK